MTMKIYVSIAYDWEDSENIYVGEDLAKAKSYKKVADKEDNCFVIEVWENENKIGKYIFDKDKNDFNYDKYLYNA